MKYAGVVVLMNPDEKVVSNIKTYIDCIDKLYVIDNTPNKDNSYLFEKNKKIEYIPNNENLGIAKALNIGAKKAINDKYDWLLTMDQDSSFEEKSLKKMQDFLHKIKTDKELIDLMNLEYSDIGLIAPFYKLAKDNEVDLGIELPLMVMTSGNLINLKIYEKINGFKEWLFIDTVDFDYCLNLQKNGYKVVELNSAILNHHLGNSKEYSFLGKRMTSSNHSPLRKYYIVRNRHYIYDMYHNDFPGYCSLEMKQTKKELIKIILFEKEKIKKIIYMLRGYRDYKRGLKGKYEDLH